MVTFLLCMEDLSTYKYSAMAAYTGFYMFGMLFKNKYLTSQAGPKETLFSGNS
jgi:hypothetical protein